MLILIIGGLAFFDLAAIGLGSDSRPSIGDDHTRPIGRGEL